MTINYDPTRISYRHERTYDQTLLELTVKFCDIYIIYSKTCPIIVIHGSFFVLHPVETRAVN